MQRVAGPVDDRLEELVPGPGRRRQAQDLVEEAELLELVVAIIGCSRRRAPSARRPRPAPGRRRLGPGRRAAGSLSLVDVGITVQA